MCDSFTTNTDWLRDCLPDSRNKSHTSITFKQFTLSAFFLASIAFSVLRSMAAVLAPSCTVCTYLGGGGGGGWGEEGGRQRPTPRRAAILTTQPLARARRRAAAVRTKLLKQKTSKLNCSATEMAGTVAAAGGPPQLLRSNKAEVAAADGSRRASLLDLGALVLVLKAKRLVLGLLGGGMGRGRAVGGGGRVRGGRRFGWRQRLAAGCSRLQWLLTSAARTRLGGSWLRLEGLRLPAGSRRVPVSGPTASAATGTRPGVCRRRCDGA